MIILERTREGHRQSDELWNRFKGDVGEISETRDGAHIGFSERIDTVLNRTDLSCWRKDIINQCLEQSRNNSLSVSWI